jgi:YQGE family putative transporter
MLAALASFVIGRGDFGNPIQPRFIFFRFHRAWVKMLGLAVLFGMGQGYLVIAPALLVLMLVGKEGALGTILACGGIVSSFVLYGLGRMAKPGHRVAVLGAGILLFLSGSLVNTAMFNSQGVVIFMVCLVIAKPTLEWAYFPIQMNVVEMVSAIEGRNQYCYIFNHELGLYTGRLLGCGVFLALAHGFSDTIALRVALPCVALVQLLAVPLANNILSHGTNRDALAGGAEVPVRASP